MGVQERKEREKHARQEAILAAAQQVFLAKGVDQATIDEIAEKAELSKGTIYLYFQSKEDLYISVLLHGLELLFEQMQRVYQNVSTTQADELMRMLKDIYYQFYTDYPEFLYMNLLFHHGRIKDKITPEIWHLTDEIAAKCLALVADIIQDGVTAGLFHPVDCWKTANSFWGSATGALVLFGDCDHHELFNLSPKEMLDYAAELLITGLKVEKS